MILKIKEAFDILQAINALEPKVRGKYALRFAQLKRQLLPEIEEYYKENQALVEKYGKVIESGEYKGQIGIVLNTEEYKKYSTEDEELKQTEVSINFIPLTEEELNSEALGEHIDGQLAFWLLPITEGYKHDTTEQPIKKAS